MGFAHRAVGVYVIKGKLPVIKTRDQRVFWTSYVNTNAKM